MQTLIAGGAIRTAQVGSADLENGTVSIRSRDEDHAPPRTARLAIPWSTAIRPGATVLLAETEDGELVVFGILEPTPTGPRHIETQDGVVAQTRLSGENETLEVVDATGELLFEYETSSQQTRIHLRGDNVQFVAPTGGIDFIADGAIRLHSRQTVDIGGELGVQVTGGQRGGAQSSLSMGWHNMRLAGHRVNVTTPLLDVAAVESRVTGQTFLGRMVHSRIVTETLEMVLGNLVQKAKNIFRRVSGIDELHAGNTRTLVEGDIHVKGGRVNVKSDSDVKIDGQQIHLG